MHFGHANRFIAAPPYDDPIVERHVGAAAPMLSHFKTSRSLSRHVQSIGIPIWSQKYVVGDRRICCLSKRRVERHPTHSALQFSAPKIFEPVFRAFNGIQRYLPSASELRGGRLGAVDRQVASNVQVPVSIQTEDLVEIRPGEALQDETGSRMRYELAGYAAIIAVEESDHGCGKTRSRGSMSKYCCSVRAIGLTKDAEGCAASRAGITDHSGAKPAGSCCAIYSITVAGSGVIDTHNAVIKISRIGIIYSNHAVSVCADTLSHHAIREARSGV